MKLDPVFTADFQARSTKCNVGAMSRALMMPETVTPRMVCRQDHSGCENAYTHLVFESDVAVVHGLVPWSVLCVDVEMCQKSVVLLIFQKIKEAFLIKAGPKQTRTCSILGLFSSYCDS